MAKKPGAPKRKRDALDGLIDGNDEWIDDLLADKPNAANDATGNRPDLPRGAASRTFRQLEVALLPAVAAARYLFRGLARGQSHPRPDPALASVFEDYRHYLHEQHVTLVTDGEEPSELFAEYDAAIGHVLDCFGKLLRGEEISRIDALKADAWLRDVPGETLLFN
jgi:hypothetical protein